LAKETLTYEQVEEIIGPRNSSKKQTSSLQTLPVDVNINKKQTTSTSTLPAEDTQNSTE
jgi:hypothetical protein